MNDIKQTGATVILDKERKVIFDLNGLCDLEDKYGSLDEALQKLTPKKGLPSAKDLRYIFLIGLKANDETLTEKQVGSFITLQNIHEIVDVIGDAMTGSLPEPTGEEKNE